MYVKTWNTATLNTELPRKLLLLGQIFLKSVELFILLRNRSLQTLILRGLVPRMSPAPKGIPSISIFLGLQGNMSSQYPEGFPKFYRRLVVTPDDFFALQPVILGGHSAALHVDQPMCPSCPALFEEPGGDEKSWKHQLAYAGHIQENTMNAICQRCRHLMTFEVRCCFNAFSISAMSCWCTSVPTVNARRYQQNRVH